MTECIKCGVEIGLEDINCWNCGCAIPNKTKREFYKAISTNSGSTDFEKITKSILYIKSLEETRKLDNQIITNLNTETVELKEAMQWFCNRVDAGEVRSKRTYERFKELLNKYE